MYKIGLVVNPLAGIGGAVGLKGSDGEEIVDEAFKRGAQPRAIEKATRCLASLTSVADKIEIITCPGEMGAACMTSLPFQYEVLAMTVEPGKWSAKDTEIAIELLLERGVDLILFAGGDGTARNVVNSLVSAGKQHDQLVLGIPAGVKIHSAVYGVTPEASGEVVEALIQGRIVRLEEAEVRDIDEEAFRQGMVKTCHYGELRVPAEARLIQQVKNGGRMSEPLALQDIASYLIEQMQDDVYYIFAPGSTTKAVTDELGVEGTLLGVDVVCNQQLVAKDVTESELLSIIDGKACQLVITVIGGQGHLLGRGNQQLSPRVIKAIGKDHFWVIATKSKLHELNHRPLLVDSGDPVLDQQFSGFVPIITGYEETVLYPVGIAK